MLIIGTFEHSIELEQALGELESKNIPRNHILVVTMDTHPKSSNRIITKSQDFYYKAIEVGVASSTACSVIGISVGFILKWGPIVWGLAAAFMGFITGFGLYCFFNKNYSHHFTKKLPEVIVIAQCSENQSLQTMETMWKYNALTVGKHPTSS